MAENKPQEVEVTEMKTGETKFGFGQIGKNTPMWSTWVFRVFFYLTSTTTLALTIFTNITPETKLLIVQWITFANLAVHGLSKMVGIEVQPNEFYRK